MYASIYRLLLQMKNVFNGIMAVIKTQTYDTKLNWYDVNKQSVTNKYLIGFSQRMLKTSGTKMKNGISGGQLSRYAKYRDMRLLK